jgi:hypothetical protein
MDAQPWAETVLSPTAMQKRLDAHERAFSERIEAPGITGVATVRHREPFNTSLNIRVLVCATPAVRHQSVVGQDTPYRDAERSGAGTDMRFHTPPASAARSFRLLLRRRRRRFREPGRKRRTARGTPPMWASG